MELEAAGPVEAQALRSQAEVVHHQMSISVHPDETVGATGSEAEVSEKAVGRIEEGRIAVRSAVTVVAGAAVDVGTS